MKKIVICILIIALLLIMVSCKYTVTSELLSYAASSKPDISGIDFSEYMPAFWNFSAELLQKQNEDKNILLSPLSLYIALSMLANGADNNTLTEIQNALGMTNKELNDFCFYIADSLTDRKKAAVNVANSLWVNKDYDCTVEKDFLDTNALFYGMEVYRDSFSKKRALTNVNNWIRNKTKNYLKDALEEIDPKVVLMLINTLYLEAKWSNKQYNYSQYTFTDVNKNKKDTDFIRSETTRYYYSENAKAVRIPLEDNFYFLGILPNENNIDAYINSFNGEELYKLINNSDISYDVFWRLPKFAYEYKAQLKETLQEMGIKDVFIPGIADLTRLGHVGNNQYYTSKVFQKTKIELDKDGIKAAAVTVIENRATSAGPNDHKEKKYIYFNRPFVYAIMDAKTDTPLFTGVIKYIK